jgi:nucleoside-diphosphate-sugar epimerase
MKVAVTGGTGFIGSRVVRILKERGHDVVCVVRTPAKAKALEDLGAELRKGDILDRKSLDAGFAGCDGVMHIAASYEIGIVGKAVEQARQQNLEGTRNALEAARDAGAKKIVYTSSIVVHGTTGGQVVDETFRYRDSWFPSAYAKSKHEAHYDVALPLMEKGAPIVVVQPGAVFGPRDHSTFRTMFHFIARGWPVPIGNATYGVISVEECALAHVLALENGKPGECYHLAQENLSLPAFARAVGKATGLPVRVVPQPDFLLKLNQLFLTVVERVVPMPAFLSSEAQGIQMSDVCLAVANEKAKRELKWSPGPLDGAFREVIRDELQQMGRQVPAQLQG